MLRRLITLALAIGLTLIVFNFWGNLSTAMSNFFAVQPANNSGEVTVKVLPAPPDCSKDHPCP